MMAVVLTRRRLVLLAVLSALSIVTSWRTVYGFESPPSHATIATTTAAAAARRHHHHVGISNRDTISFVALHAATDRIDGGELMRKGFKKLLVPNADVVEASSSSITSSGLSDDQAFQQAFANVLSTSDAATSSATSSSSNEAVTTAVAKTASAASSAAADLAESMERLQRELMATVQSQKTPSLSLPDIDLAVPDKIATQVAQATSTASSNMDALLRTIQEGYQSINVDTSALSSFSSSSQKTVPTFAEYLTAQGVNVNDMLSNTQGQNWLANTENGQKFSTLMHEMMNTLLHPTAIANSAQAFGDSLVAIATVLQQDAWSNQDLRRALNVEETGNWYLATAAFIVFVLGATATNSMEESYKYQKHDYLIQSYLQETVTSDNDSTTTTSVDAKNQAELTRVQNQVEQLTQATAAVADFLVQLQKDKANKDVDMASLKMELCNMQSQLQSTRTVEQDLRESLEATQQELRTQTNSLQKDLEQRARAEHALQIKLAATEKSLQAERERVLAAATAAREQEMTMRSSSRATSNAAADADADNTAIDINNQILAALSTEKDSMIAQVETIQREMQNLRELLKNQAVRQQAAATAAVAAMKKKTTTTAAAAPSSSSSSLPPPSPLPVTSPPPPPPAAAVTAKEEEKEQPAKPSDQSPSAPDSVAATIASVHTAYFSSKEETTKKPTTTTTTTTTNPGVAAAAKVALAEPEPVVVAAKVATEPEPVVAAKVAAEPEPVVVAAKVATEPEPVVAAKVAAEPEPVVTAKVAAEPEPAAAVPPKKQVVKGSSSSSPSSSSPPESSATSSATESKKSTKTKKKKETPKPAAAVAPATPAAATSTRKSKTITIKKASAPKAEPKMEEAAAAAVTAATAVVADTAANNDDGGGGEDDDDEQDWSQLAASTLKRKTIKDLIAYLESRGADTTGPDGKVLKKDLLVKAVLEQAQLVY